MYLTLVCMHSSRSCDTIRCAYRRNNLENYYEKNTMASSICSLHFPAPVCEDHSKSTLPYPGQVLRLTVPFPEAPAVTVLEEVGT